MKATITPSKNNETEIKIPASKSLLHRDLICASLAKGTSIISNVDLNDDVLATINCLKNLGINITFENNTLIVVSKGKLSMSNNQFYPKESGSTLRFLIPIIGSLTNDAYFHLEGKLGSRPLNDYEKIFNENGAKLKYTNENLLYVRGPLYTTTFHLKGNVTSQYISGLLMASPLINDDVKVIVEKPVESLPYIHLTIGEMLKFGVKIETLESENEIVYYKKKDENYQSKNVTVEGDYSQAAFFLSLGMINNPVVLNNMIEKSLQGDAKIMEFINQFGGELKFIDGKLISYPFNINKKEITLDIKDTPDLGPILMGISAIIPTKTYLINTHRLIYKESNRSAAMQSELNKIGSKITVFDNEIIIEGIDLTRKKQQEILEFDSHNDHRIVMSLAIIATKLNYVEKIIINHVEAINKSYPKFFDDLQKVGIKVVLED